MNPDELRRSPASALPHPRGRHAERNPDRKKTHSTRRRRGHKKIELPEKLRCFDGIKLVWNSRDRAEKYRGKSLSPQPFINPGEHALPDEGYACNCRMSLGWIHLRPMKHQRPADERPGNGCENVRPGAPHAKNCHERQKHVGDNEQERRLRQAPHKSDQHSRPANNGLFPRGFGGASLRDNQWTHQRTWK
jgi:hypothetical protein